METVLGYNESEERREAMGPKAKQSPESVVREIGGRLSIVENRPPISVAFGN